MKKLNTGKQTQMPIQPEPIEMSRMIVFAPTELKNKFKKVSIVHDMDMSKGIRKLMEEYVENNPIEIKRLGLRKPREKKAGAVNE
jgi:hypothetical protein